MSRLNLIVAGVVGAVAVGALVFEAGLNAGKLAHPKEPAVAAAKAFAPPADSAAPKGPIGEQIALGRKIFTDTGHAVPQLVGNDLKCSNCHLDAGRLASSAPLWGAYTMFPQFRAKNGHVITFQERMQGCFMYSMNGKAPPQGDPILVALESYSAFLAQGARIGAKIPGQGYPKLPKPAQPADYERGQALYGSHCAMCHGNDGGGQSSAGEVVFPALWGKRSYNWGAGMSDLPNASGFIKANMPYSQGGTLTDQQAWDLALYIDSQPRPQDPRYTGSVEETRAKFHNDPSSMYGKTVNGVLLGGDGAPHAVMLAKAASAVDEK